MGLTNKDIKVGDYLLYISGSSTDKNSIVKVLGFETDFEDYVIVQFMKIPATSHRQLGARATFYPWRFQLLASGDVEDIIDLTPLSIKIRSLEARFHKRKKK